MSLTLFLLVASILLNCILLYFMCRSTEEEKELSVIEVNSMKLKDLMYHMMKMDLGIQMKIFGVTDSLHISQLNGKYFVSGKEEKKPYQVNEWKYETIDINEALEKFLDKRALDKIGDDYRLTQGA
jgi:hypothetical protein